MLQTNYTFRMGQLSSVKKDCRNVYNNNTKSTSFLPRNHSMSSYTSSRLIDNANKVA